MQYEPPAINFPVRKETPHELREGEAAGHGAVGANAHQTGQSAARQGAGATLLIMAGMHGCALRPARCEL